MEDLAHRLTAPPDARRVAVIGAGYAGLACAVELARQGHRVTVFEASRSLGGRARRVDLHGHALDNGQHLLLGAYTELLRLMRAVGADPKRLMLRTPLDLVVPGSFRLRAARLPRPLHLLAGLLSARGLAWRERLAALRFMRSLKARRFRLDVDLTVSGLLSRHRQPRALRELLWEPLCLAALNTPPDRASAQVYCHVLRDALAGPRGASDLLFPAADLGALFPDPAAAWLRRRGHTVHLGRAVTALVPHDDAVEIHHAGGAERFDHAVLAVAPYHAGALLPADAAFAGLRQQLAALRHEPIATAYFAFPPRVLLPHPMVGRAGGLGQWWLDRGRLNGQPGVLAAVISAGDAHHHLPREALLAQLHDELRELLPDLPAPLWRSLIVEKRATFACTPSLPRPGAATPHPRLWLAGDYVAGDYPATLEGAVRSGVAVARQVH